MSDDKMKERFEKFYLAALTGVIAQSSRSGADLDNPRADAEKAYAYAQYAIQVMDGKWESGRSMRDWDRRSMEKRYASQEAMDRIAELDEEMGL